MPTSKIVAIEVSVKDAQPTVKVIVALKSTDCGTLTPYNKINSFELEEI